VLCGDAKSVHVVSPCAHLICRTCWDGSDLSACPLCLRRIDPKDPFLKPSFDEEQPAHVRSDRLRLLSLAAVEERFDLTGPAKILLPFGVDLLTKELRWYDVNLSAAGYGHNVSWYGGHLALMAATLEEVHGSGDRVSLWEICCWHAAARAVLTGDIAARSGAEIYALHPRLLDHASHTLIDAPHLLSVLAPDTRAHASLPS